jgi:hypothetical protein
MALPDFLVIGAPKAGTTALHEALAAHPQLFLSDPKEPKYFLCGDRPPPRPNGPGDAHSVKEWIWERAAYEALFDDAPTGTLRGESTPLYLADHESHARMAALVPDARLVVVVRDPVDRAYSNWAHLWADGLEPEGDFLTACALEDRRMEAGWAPFWRYKAQGLYGRHLQSLFRHFPRSRVHVLRYRRLVGDPVATLDGICTFLGVDTGIVRRLPDANVSSYIEPSRFNRLLQSFTRGGAAIGQHLPPHVWRTLSRPLTAMLKRRDLQRPDLTASDRAKLIEFFMDDIELLEQLTGRCFDDWRTDADSGAYVLRKHEARVEEPVSG